MIHLDLFCYLCFHDYNPPSQEKSKKLKKTAALKYSSNLKQILKFSTELNHPDDLGYLKTITQTDSSIFSSC